MELAELLSHVTDAFDRIGIEYLVTGSMATIAYGEPRLTNDIDLVVRISPWQVRPLCDEFPERDFYVSFDMAAAAVARKGQFNILHPKSGLKVDVMVAEESAFNASRFGRARSITMSPERVVSFASPEDVILKKLEYYRDGGSDKHLRDIAGVLKVMGSDIDDQYLTAWAQRLGLSQLWRDVHQTATADPGEG